MAIKLKWKNPNTASSVVNIYRAVAPMTDLGNFPAPITTISNGDLTYVDEVPQYGESFYYIFSVTVGGKTYYSNNRLYKCEIDLGPGPQDLIMGDFRYGYFGTITEAELGFTFQQLYGFSAIGIYKVAIGGKILYIHSQGWSAGVQQAANAKVLNSGITVANDYFAGSAGLIREFSGRLFAPRCAKLYDQANTDLVNANYSVATTPHGKSELMDVMRMLRRRTDTTNFKAMRFSLNIDGTAYNGGARFSGSDTYASGGTTTYADDTAMTGVTTIALTTASYLFPVVEYKGAA